MNVGSSRILTSIRESRRIRSRYDDSYHPETLESQVIHPTLEFERSRNGDRNIGIVIVAYRSAENIKDCLRGCALTENLDQIIVVDNSSEEACRRATHDFMMDQAIDVEYVASTNAGFASGCNLGASRLRDAPYIAFVNPDVRLTRSLDTLANSLGHVPFAAVAGRLDEPGSKHVHNARKGFSILRELKSCIRGADNAYHLTQFDTSAPGTWMPVGQIAGALIVLRTNTFHECGGFDRRYELYYEDVALADALNLYGGSGVLNELWGYHDGGKSSASVPEASFVVGRVSRSRYIRSRYGSRTSLPIVASIAICDFISRGIGRTREGNHARLIALRAQFQELWSPGSVSILK